MALADDIRAEVKAIFNGAWTERDGSVVPDTDDLKLSNDAVKLTGTVLYADLAESTAMVNRKKAWFAAEVYKSFLISACRIIRYRGGEITAFDGDRVMAVFIGGSKNRSAAKAALNINWAVKMVNEELTAQYTNSDQIVRHGVGVDTSNLFVARTGIRGSNDLVWVGRSANYAAKLCELRTGNYASWITGDVYDAMNEEAKYSSDGRSMWEARTWNEYGLTVYRSSWYWRV